MFVGWVDILSELGVVRVCFENVIGVVLGCFGWVVWFNGMFRL